MYFPQEHPPGREAQIDFTHCKSLGVSIGGQPYAHLLFQFVLSYSGWRYTEVAGGETYLALQRGLQGALWTLGGVPQVVRSDNTAALTHEMRRSGGRELNYSYAGLLAHYGLESTRSNPGMAHENGVAEQAHYRLKDALNQGLLLRGSRDLPAVCQAGGGPPQPGGPREAGAGKASPAASAPSAGAPIPQLPGSGTEVERHVIFQEL